MNYYSNGFIPFINEDRINKQIDNQLYGSYEGYTKGNMFKDEYLDYKNYKPQRLIPKSPEEEALLNLNQIQFAMHDANLYLDVFPDDKDMMNEYIKYKNQYNRLLSEYESKFGVLNTNSNSIMNIPFIWEEQSFPWNRRGL